MAKKILAEEFSLNSYDLKLDGNNKLQFNSVTQADATDISSIDTRVSKETSLRDSKVKSIDTRVSTEVSTRGKKIDSLDIRVSLETSTRGKNIDSLDTRVSLETSNRGVAINSIDTRVSSDIKSLDERLTDEENTTKILANQDVTNGASSQAVSLVGLGFVENSEPVVVGMLRSTDSDDPIVACMLSGAASHSTATFLFSDEIPSNNYKLDVILTR